MGGPADGPGHFKGYNFTASLAPTGPVDEQAIFLGNVSEVIFVEHGLTSGTPWSVTLRGLGVTTNQSTASFYEINNTWGYQVSNVSGYRLEKTPGFGYVTVDGTSTVTVQVYFDQFFPVYFEAVGLPAGTDWNLNAVGINGSEWDNSSATTKTFYEINGGWGYQASTAAGYHVNESVDYGHVIVSNSSTVVQIVFQRLYSVSFSEVGLPAGTPWSIGLTEVDGTSWNNSSASAKTFYELNNTFNQTRGTNNSWPYQVGNVSGYHIEETTGYGSVTVTGTNIVVRVVFERLYLVVFNEVGLSTGTSWTIGVSEVNGTHWDNTSAGSKTFLEINNTFNQTRGTNNSWSYEVANIPGYHLMESANYGSVSVDGKTVVVRVDFQRIYTIVFDEVGLPPGTPWSVGVVQVNGTYWDNTSTGSKPFSEINNTFNNTKGTNNSWPYQVANVPGYHLSHPVGFGSVTVTGSDVVVQVLFELLYPIVFKEVGIPGGR